MIQIAVRIDARQWVTHAAGGRSVLVVDNDELLQQLLGTALHTIGLTVQITDLATGQNIKDPSVFSNNE